MSSVKQEVAAILIDYHEQIPDKVYMDILTRLGNISNHKDPKKATELQKEVDTLELEKEKLEDIIMDMQMRIDTNEDEIERLYNSIDDFLGIDKDGCIQDRDQKSHTRTIRILPDENNISIYDDSLDNQSNIDYFDETLNEYYNRKKSEIKDGLKTSATIRKLKSVNYTINNLIGHRLMFDTRGECMYFVSTYTYYSNNEKYEKNIREQRYNKNLTNNNSTEHMDNIIDYSSLM